MKRQYLLLIVCLVFTAGMSRATVYEGVCGEHLTWSYDTETAHMTIEGYGELKNTVDSLWWNKQVLQASSWATDYKTYYPYNSCKTISLPEGLTGFSGATFRDWWNLTACEIPEGVTKIPAYMFEKCYKLKEIRLPNSVDTVGQFAFANCTTMVKCDLGKGVKYIGQMAFENCYGLKSVRWSDCLEVIDGSIFDGEPNRAVYDMNSVATIPLQDTLFFPATFRSSKQISWCIHSSPVIVWNAKNPPASSSVFYNLYCYWNGDFIFGPDVEFVPTHLCQWSRMKKVVLPEGVQWIGQGAFMGNSILDTVVLPSTLTAIHQQAFQNCSKITRIVLPDGMTAVSSSCFAGCTSLARVHLPKGATTIGDNAFSGCSSLDSIVLPEALTMVGGSAFSGIKKQDTLVIPDKVISIGTNAFENWSGLKELSIGKNVVLIGDNAFKGDSAVTHIAVWAATPPSVSEGTLADIPDSAWLSVLPDSRKLYSEHPYWGRFRMSDVPDSAMIQRTVIVDAAETTADFTWPTDSAAHSYQIDIYKDGAVFCKLTLGPRGQLLGINFSAPGRKNKQMVNEQMVNDSQPYTLSFKVTGLDEASRYNYVLSVLDANGTPIHVYVGDFATLGYEGELKGGGNEIIPTPPIIPSNPEAQTPTGIDKTAAEDASVLFRDGQLLLVTEDGIFDILGRRIE
ncbi:MAG: leucine-rich repeat domain-containing protein [Paludibacteraceae bacterium]|nr:leucine-rich repeat domain-containing protein [Paludibacteraceae bacterium]